MSAGSDHELYKKISCKTKNGFISSILVGLIISNSAWSVNASDDAIILLYHKFSEPAKSTISINRDNFSNHIKELTSGPYNVLPLAQLIRSLEINQALPERTIIITLDEAYRSILKCLASTQSKRPPSDALSHYPAD